MNHLPSPSILACMLIATPSTIGRAGASRGERSAAVAATAGGVTGAVIGREADRHDR